MTVPPTDIQRCVDFEGAHNFRDLGGYDSRFGGATRWGRVFRAGSLDRMTADDLDRLGTLEVDTVVDLRNGDERERAPDPVGSLHIPIMGSFMSKRERPDFRALVEHDHGVAFMRDMNLGLLEHASNEIGQVFGVLAGTAGRPVVFHCTAGKDRTGLVAALLLEVLGVDRETVLDDFQLTERYAGPREESHGWRRMIEFGVAPEAAAGAFGAPRPMMSDVLDVLDARYGGAECYLVDQARVTPDTLANLRDHLLV
jgi:protein-tyrosine phosphatase